MRTKFFLFVLLTIFSIYNLKSQTEFNLYGWGDNTFNQLGFINESENPTNIPFLFSTDTDWSQISTFDNHTLVLKSDGTLWAWGWNEEGQLGDGTFEDSDIPIQIGEDDDWIYISAGGEHSLAIKSDGTLWAWGYNEYGQLGDNTDVGKNTPVQIGTDTDWLSVSAGYYHSLAMKTDGTLWAWGWNLFGQLGDGAIEDKLVPTQIGSDDNWAMFMAGAGHSFAMKDNGTLWAWGYNEYGQLGDGTTDNQTSPIQIGTDDNWEKIFPGVFHTLALKSDGTLWAWGYNEYGQLGNGTTDNQTSPIQIGTDDNWTDITIGLFHSLALKDNGTLWAWGSNEEGQLGDGTYENSLIPILISTDMNWESICANYLQSYAIKSDGTLWTWGYFETDEVEYYIYETPTFITSAENISNVDASYDFTFILNTDGTLQATGSNEFGKLGNGNILPLKQFTQIGEDDDWESISTGPYHTLALKTDGTLWAWGSNLTNQLGIEDIFSIGIPIQIGDNNDWSKVYACDFHSFAIKSDGTLWGWGLNIYGQVGIEGENTINTPTKVSDDNDWISISGGSVHTLALKTDGTLWAWGNNQFGQLGDNTNENKNVPTQIGSDNDWILISAGDNFSIALKEDGTLWAWGLNEDGQLGDGTTISRNVPTQIAMDEEWTMVSAGALHTLAINADGTLWAWGLNNDGQLGDGSTSNSIIPIQIGTNDKWFFVSAGYNHSFGIAGQTFAPELPTIITTDVINITSNSATSGGEITDNGGAEVTARGICWSTSEEPTLDDDFTEDGEGSGIFESMMTGLEPNTIYYVRAYATNSVGTAYGNELTFTTLPTEVIPTVITMEVYDVEQRRAKSGGEVTNDGGAAVTARGVCWSTSQNPTLDDDFTEDGEGLWEFTSILTNLQPNTPYYVRAYATNSVGTAYGNQVTFITLNVTYPTIFTNPVTNITLNTALTGGNITHDGGADITVRGVCWSTSQNPTLEDNFTSDGTGIGVFESNLTGLESNTTYYVRAYATNSFGTVYGNQQVFITAGEITLPTLVTAEITQISGVSAVSGGTITNNGGAAISARGVCWSTSENPTLDDNFTSDGTGAGAFVSTITGLTSNTTYYVRAYATNSLGTAYGNQLSFTATETSVIDRTQSPERFLLHPNPSSDYLNIQSLDSDITKFFVEIYDLNGNSIPININEETRASMNINISGLANGSYTLVIKHNNLLYTYKFIKN